MLISAPQPKMGRFYFIQNGDILFYSKWRYFILMTQPKFKVPFPFEVPFFNKGMDKFVMKHLIRRFVNQFGMTYTSHILDQLKILGFQQATDAAISLGIDDLLTTPAKLWLIQDVQQQGFASERQHDYGNVHAVEKLRQLIEIWHATSEYLKREMNPNFKMTDPLNPVHMMSFSGARGSLSQVHQLVGMRGLISDPQGKIVDLPIQGNLCEGLSLTEYIISCYGARKGVVDTSIRTADAGYLTRRLVEVVQHLVVRKVDCGTIQGLFVNLIQDQETIKNQFVLQTLIGRVLADDVYINGRCIATRNEDIGMKLANQLYYFQIQPIYIRTPFTCKSISWICQLCYGRNTIHSNLIELGEAVGIIAGQSIGEPGTQLTLRTFHTGGVFTGDIAEHIRAPFTGKMEFNENLVSPTRTRHGHPAYICHNSLDVTIDNQYEVKNLTIPPESLLFIQNNQLVESEQVIAEIRAKKPPFKEKVKKYIYSGLTGEIHWNIPIQSHLIDKTTHLWVLSGGIYESAFHKDQDQVDIPELLLYKHKSLSNYSVDQVKHESVDSNCFEKGKKILNYLETDRTIPNKHQDSIDCTILFENTNNMRVKNELIVPLWCDKQWVKRRIPCPYLILRIPREGILYKNDNIFAFFNDRFSMEKERNFLENQLDGKPRLKVKKAYASLISVRTNTIIINMIQISLLKYPFFNMASSPFLFHNKLGHTNSFFSNDQSQLLSKGTIRSVPNKNKKEKSFLILSPSDFLQIVLFNDLKCLNTVKKSDANKKIPLSGLLGHLHSIANRFPDSHLMTYKKVLLNEHSISNYDSNTFQGAKCYFMDEKRGIYKFDSCKNIIFNFFNLNLYFSLSNFFEKTFPVVSLGQFFCESIWISEDKQLQGSGQIVVVREESFIIRLSKPYLGTRGATHNSYYGRILYEGDTLITMSYERLKSDDIIQGLPKVEQLSEARSNTLISKNRKKKFKELNRHLAIFFGNFWGSFTSVRITMEDSQNQLVNEIQKIYRSQGVQISDKHIEIIVRQITSKVLVVDVEKSENQNFENGLDSVFLPGELIGLSRVQRMDRALEKRINYRTILLGMTNASLNTQSFLSEASFQETARVLAKSALQGRIDWLKGLKENVILGRMIPVGTGFNSLEKRSKMDPRMRNKSIFINKVIDFFFDYEYKVLSQKQKKKVKKKLVKIKKKKSKRAVKKSFLYNK
uniref:DNA-directed RNA polymerase subunit beta'' n=1 Tax=Chamaecyparis obtusa var. obtusa TaxID=257617 RepID=A0A7R6UZP0_CHAOB|nr:RNA polymerase beta subunit-2 [Chamaecyparis obtusa var. obtusa]BCB64903.1 RNA polymerase beta subunit-2 [Chamaecyparis obtusa var. obtusa]BCB65069.1 RNA polymerase beta subunit-2 [Chamaecyparis obtusa var. obtusa]BCB65152.1 RNA polymerase beta subunit-2 [Chamaecyparis obtusa var. obtusa]BCB65235.1 RNA polymerase beta subunit-2 [Chamaecyparis obtusa var. obtusa]